MDIKAAIQPVLDSPKAQALLAHVTTEESKQAIIADLYDMLPGPFAGCLRQKYSRITFGGTFSAKCPNSRSVGSRQTLHPIKRKGLLHLPC